MTIAELSPLLLNDFAKEERSIPDHADFPGRNAEVLKAINAALQELFGEGSPWLRYDEIGFIVNAPTQVSISATNGSTVATIISGWAAWMAGCSIVIEGSAIENQIRNASASAVLKFPYDGTTGSHSATVHHNSITIPSNVMQICEPVKYDRRMIGPVVSSGISIHTRQEEDYGARGQYRTGSIPDTISQTSGTPVAYAVDTYTASDTATPVARLRLLPSPSAAGSLEIRAKIAPPVVTSLTSTDTLPIAQQFIQTIFFPVARKHLSGCPFFLHSSSAEEIMRAYQEARRLLDLLQPNKNQGRVLRSIY